MAGALLAALLGFAWAKGNLHTLSQAELSLLGCVFFGLYAAHLTDTYVDVFGRGDRTPTSLPLAFRDSTGLLEEGSYPPIIAAAAAACALLGAPAAAQGGPAVAGLLAGALALALAYSVVLDKTLLGVTLGYPMGAAAVFLAAYLAAGGRLDRSLAFILVPLVTALVGTKVRADAIDLADDAAIGKRTLPVVLGARVAVRTGLALTLAGLAAWAALPAFVALTPLFSVAPVLAAAAVCWSARKSAVEGSLQTAYALVLMLAAEVAVVAAVGR